MDVLKKIEIFGDSILKGIQLNSESLRYHTDNHINIEMLSAKYSLEIKNFSKFGCTVTKGSALLEKHLQKGLACDAIIMDFGGNDCDYNWRAISENPNAPHAPNTPLDMFIETYHQLIGRLKQRNILPVLTTLPPLEPQRFFDWFCKGLDKEAILKWLGSVMTIYQQQELYSRTVERIAREAEVPLVDLRGAFLRHFPVKSLLCEDGTHPNTAGQEVITAAFSEFAQARIGART